MSTEALTVLNGVGCTGLSAEQAVRMLLLMRIIEVFQILQRLQLHRDQYLDDHGFARNSSTASCVRSTYAPRLGT